ncbi:MAG: hypothetical protein ACYCZF_15735 [Anaerolineae bacterium]
MVFKPNRVQLDAVAVQVRDTFSSHEMGVNAAALVPEIVRCLGRLVASAADLAQLGQAIHTILTSLPSYAEETSEGTIERYDLAFLATRAHRAQDLVELVKQFTRGDANPTDQGLLSRYKGPSEPFGIQGEFYRAVLPVMGVAHAMQILAQLGVTSKPEDIGCIFIEDIAGVSVWGNITEQQDGNWTMVLEVHDPHSSYEATYTAFARACIVNQVLAKYIISIM